MFREAQCSERLNVQRVFSGINSDIDHNSITKGTNRSYHSQGNFIIQDISLVNSRTFPVRENEFVTRQNIWSHYQTSNSINGNDYLKNGIGFDKV